MPNTLTTNVSGLQISATNGPNHGSVLTAASVGVAQWAQAPSMYFASREPDRGTPNSMAFASLDRDGSRVRVMVQALYWLARGYRVNIVTESFSHPSCREHPLDFSLDRGGLVQTAVQVIKDEPQLLGLFSDPEHAKVLYEPSPAHYSISRFESGPPRINLWEWDDSVSNHPASGSSVPLNNSGSHNVAIGYWASGRPTSKTNEEILLIEEVVTQHLCMNSDALAAGEISFEKASPNSVITFADPYFIADWLVSSEMDFHRKNSPLIASFLTVVRSGKLPAIPVNPGFRLFCHGEL